MPQTSNFDGAIDVVDTQFPEVRYCCKLVAFEDEGCVAEMPMDMQDDVALK
ncbi:MAG: hypothetical protein QM576_14985 [Rhodopseudomonas sp.]|uniref:hypothetical protein n=1 Tax=unclassified Rhodopseudomonas TaxID=2638247 RepID=UPI0013DEABFD|nr:hypothetical protein [Rhodopseudomonas sp. BR0M22]